MIPSISAGLRLRNLLSLLAVFALLGACPTVRVVAQESTDERFLFVQEWVGHLSIRATASGTQNLGEATVTYSIDRHLNYPLALKALVPGIGTWTTCDVSRSRGSIDDLIVTRLTRSGCEQAIHQVASGPLQTPPPSPFPSPGAPPCVLNGFQFQIIPVPGDQTYTSWGFFDTIDGEQTITNSGGGNCGSSSITVDWATGFLPGDVRPLCQGTDCLTLPEDGYSIVQGWSFDSLESTNAPRVSVHYDVQLELTGCGEEVEVVVEPFDYENWRPTGGDHEDDPGNDLVVEARLQGRGGCAANTKATRFRFELEDVSAEPGVCMNWPPEGSGIPGRADLAFVADRNFGPWKPVTPPGVKLETEDGSYSEAPRVFVSSFDWGGRASLKVTAELPDGRSIVGHLINDNAVTEIPIPRRKPGSKIAEGWKISNGASGLPDSSDEEKDPPGDGHRGDGLFLYEEYRGFYEGDPREHVEGNPKKKDLFVVDRANGAPGIALCGKVSGLEIHGKMLRPQVSPQRTVNFNRSDDVGNENDQHALLLERADLPAGLSGIALGGPALPAFVTRVLLKRSFRPRSVTVDLAGDSTTVTQEAFVTAHEILHGCNVFHHGESGGKVDLDAVFVDEKWAYSSPAGIVSLLKEGPCGREAPILPRSAADDLHNIYVATQQGKHSGQANCVMRYNFAKYYTDEAGSKIWRHEDEEPPGYALCNSATGTGPGGCLRPRYGDALVGCCAKQICVNDSRDHTPGEPPASPCGGGGGGEELPGAELAAGGDGGGTPAGSTPEPRISLAINEERDATVHRGWPILVTVQAFSTALGDAEPTQEILLTSPGGSWTDSLRFHLEKDGAPVGAWLMLPSAPSAGELALDATQTGVHVAWVSPEKSALIHAGNYALRATLDTTGSPRGWTGVTSSEIARISVIDEPSPLTPALEVEKALGFALWFASRGALTEALRTVDELLAHQPGLAIALIYRAEILDLAGNESAALDAYETALASFLAAQPDPEEWPEDVLRRLDTLQRKLVLEGTPDEAIFRRGDTNADGIVNLSDPVTMLGYLFQGAPRSLECHRSADSDDSGAVDIADAVYLLRHLFLGAAAPPPPFGSCGPDRTIDALSCTTQAVCRG